MSPPFPYAGEASAALSGLCWAVAGILFVRVRPRVSAPALNLGKNATGALGFVLLLPLVHGTFAPSGLDLRAVALLAASGIVGLAFCDSLLFRAFLEIGPRRSQLFMVIAPVLVATLAMLPPLSELPPLWTWLGIALCLVGVTVAVQEGSDDAVRRLQLRRGARDAIGAAFLHALGMLLAREALRGTGVGVVEASAVRLVAGCLGLVGMGLVVGRLGSWRRELQAGRAWVKVAFAALIGTFAGIGANQAGLAWSAHAGVAATLNSLSPVFLVPLSAWFLAEPHERRAWISALLAVGGVALMMLA